ncbi:MAG: hypothetical protein KJ069_04810 [Anaerolineae bacterium]|nr:hypothetical protein [Anaerolineae bacterium]
MEDDQYDNLNAKREHLEEWAKRLKKANEILPFVQMQLDITNWELEALDARPEEASEIVLPGLMGTFKREHDYLIDALPLMPDYDARSILNSTAVSTAGSANFYEYISRVGDLGTPIAIEYAHTFTGAYQKLQEAQNRLEDVRNLVKELNNPQTLERLDRAADGPQSTNCDEVIRQEAKRSSLIQRLSEIAKDREGGALTKIENVWVQMLDHAYTVLRLVNLSK